jgi:ribosomal-protein-alanine N-acetyltransferase
MLPGTITVATLADAKPIASMSARLVETGLPRSWTARRVEKHILRTGSVVLTSRVDDRLVGFAIMHFGDEAAHLNLLAVEPAYQRRGIGRCLVNWLEQSAITAGTFMVSLEVRADNVGALQFYRELGYQETGLIPDYYSGMCDAALLARDLSVRYIDLPSE